MTLLEALRCEVDYPLDEIILQKKLLDRALGGEHNYTPEIGISNAFIGAIADSLKKLVTTPDVGESGITISLPNRQLIIDRMNELYKQIGETQNMQCPTVERIGFYG